MGQKGKNSILGTIIGQKKGKTVLADIAKLPEVASRAYKFVCNEDIILCCYPSGKEGNIMGRITPARLAV
jgi:hypothetical protein